MLVLFVIAMLLFAASGSFNVLGVRMHDKDPNKKRVLNAGAVCSWLFFVTILSLTILLLVSLVV